MIWAFLSFLHFGLVLNVIFTYSTLLLKKKNICVLHCLVCNTGKALGIDDSTSQMGMRWLMSSIIMAEYVLFARHVWSKSGLLTGCHRCCSVSVRQSLCEKIVVVRVLAKSWCRKPKTMLNGRWQCYSESCRCICVMWIMCLMVGLCTSCLSYSASPNIFTLFSFT